ncbi:MAG: hypothetical protein ACRDND_23450 [Streptosporangiaceae bacterium]
MRYMYDSVDPESIPAGAETVAGYPSLWPEHAWAEFPGAQLVRIARHAAEAGCDVLDVEAGDATPADVAGWVTRRREAGHRWHAVYCSLDTVPAVFDSASPVDLQYGVWVAHWTGSPHREVLSYKGRAIPAVAVQYANLASRNVDVSVIWQPGWHAGPAQ